MASQTLWKREQGVSARQRTPSPPPRSRVDWLPEADVSQTATRYYQRLQSQKKRRYDAVASRKEDSHGRYGGYSGAMDALASTALASGDSTSSQHRLSASAADGERPSKRARSEKFWAVPAPTSSRRPTTSYEQPTSEEAQLLLDFQTAAARSTTGRAASSNHYRSASFGSRSSYAASPTYQTTNAPLPQYQSAFDRPQTAVQLRQQKEAVQVDSHPNGSPAAQDAKDVDTNDKQDTPASGTSEVVPSQEVRQKSSKVMEEMSDSNVNGGTPSSNLGGFSHSQQSNHANKEADTTSKPPNGQSTAPAKSTSGSNSTSSVTPSQHQSESNGNINNNLGDNVKKEDQNTLNGAQMPKNDLGGIKPEHSTSNKPPLSDDTPQVCAACNFHRNSLTLETENEATSWISCDGCNKWFHFACAGFKTQREVRSVDKFRCKTCRPLHGPTTYVRKSARAHAPIDYAELNQGVVKTSEESPEHHYIKPIKEGSIKFTPESFARIRPELVTAEFWLRGDGMKEPVVIPAEWNPRPRRIPLPEAAPQDTTEDPADDAILHDQSALDGDMVDQFECDQVPDEGQDLLDMVIPQDLTVRRVAELYGPEEKIEVIDVKSQNGEDKRWNMRKWAEYYESTAPNKPVRNVISLEVSQSKLGRLIRRPKVVRDLDLQDAVWPPELTARGDYPKVQFYCLMSVADCYTDFHIDFGGSSVYYHILKGKKTFFFIPPTDANLKKYEDWCNSEAQNYTFLGDQTKICHRVDLGEGDTMLIPAGWIHAVWTPEDSLVIGGNFLTRQNYSMQIRVTQVEKATKVPKKFRYPHFQKIMWYTMIRYLGEDPIPQSVMDILLSGKTFERKKPIWDDYELSEDNSEPEPEPKPGSERYNSRYYAKCELDGLPELVRYLQRTAYIVAGFVTDGVSSDTKRAVQRSIPKEHKHHGTEPIDCVRKFAMWCAWKRGNEYLPHWVYPDHVPEVNAPEVTQKKLSAAHVRRLEREAAMSAQRVSDRPQREKKPPSNLYNEMMAEQEKVKALKASSPSSTPSIKQEAAVATEPEATEISSPSARKEGQAKRRKSGGTPVSKQPACESCRKGRRACKHRDHTTQEATDGQPSTPAVASSNLEMDLESTMDGVEVPNGVDGLPTDETPTSPEVRVVVPLGTDENQHAMSPTKEPSTPSRTKACADCRKSKRRCIHDEYGRQDPIKMAQVAQPRPAAKKKRNSDAAADGQPKKPLKRPMSSSAVQPPPSAISTATPLSLVDSSIVQPATQQPTPVMPSETLSQVDDEASHTNSVAQDIVNEEEAAEGACQGSSSALVSPPDSTHTDHERTASPRRSPNPGTEEVEKRRDLTPPTTASEPRSRRTSQLPASKLSIVAPNSPVQARSRAMSTASTESSKVQPAKQSISNASKDADEETMRLIHEMMAEERGLRTRRESKPA